jgi:hypothetical protein
MGTRFKELSNIRTPKQRLIAILTAFHLLLYCSNVFSQPLNGIALFSHWSTYFKQEQTYSFPITPLAMPGFLYEYHSNKVGNIGFNLGMEMNLQPVFSIYRFSVSDTNFMVPTEWQFNEIHEGYMVSPLAISMGLNCGMYYRHQDSPHQFNLGLSVFRTLNPKHTDGASMMGRPPSGQGPALPFANFLQRYDFHPNGVVALRLQASYRYHFTLFKQPFYALSRIDYQLNNRPQVLFEVFNENDVLVNSFMQHYPRFYGSFGLGWSWGAKK